MVGLYSLGQPYLIPIVPTDYTLNIWSLQPSVQSWYIAVDGLTSPHHLFYGFKALRRVALPWQRLQLRRRDAAYVVLWLICVSVILQACLNRNRVVLGISIAALQWIPQIQHFTKTLHCVYMYIYKVIYLLTFLLKMKWFSPTIEKV